MPADEPSQAPSSGGIHVGDVGGSVNFSALGHIVGGNLTISTTVQISVEAVTQRPLVTASPYRGLERFEDREKDLFFGRDQLIKSLLAQLSTSNVLLLLGASGSGKSSVVRAGLLPALSGLLGARFRYFTLVPDINPFESLRSSLQSAGFTQSQTRDLADAQSGTPSKLIHALQREGDQWLIFVDQFEEIFTRSEKGLRRHFLAALIEIALDTASSTKLVLAMRADFLDRFSIFPQFAKLIEKNIDLVADMHSDELRLAIEQPAARHGVVFDQGLVEEIIKDVQGQAGSLPLLQYTLDLLWEEERRQNGLAGRHLKAQTYRELGGVRGALQKRADEFYASFGDKADPRRSSTKQEIVRQIFLRLVDIAGVGSDDAVWRPVRRRAGIGTFGAAQEQELLQALINQKLLVSNREGTEATVEVAHEALFTSWERLKKWIEGGRQIIFIKNRLADDARRWARRQQEDRTGADEELLGGSRLGQVLEMRARGDFVTVVGGLSETETQFLDASAALRDRRRQEEQDRQQRELAQAQALASEQKKRADDQVKANARQRRLTIAMVLVALLTVVAAVFALTKQKQAEGQARIALSRELAAAATHGLDAELSLLLAREAVLTTYRQGEPVPKEAEEALRANLPPKPVSLSTGHTEPITALALGPDGRKLATASDKMVKLWDADTGNELLSVPKATNSFGSYAKVVGITFSGDGQRLALASEGGANVWDVASGRQLLDAKLRHGGYVQSFAFSPEGRHLAISGPDEVSVWDVNARQEVLSIASESSAQRSGLIFSPDSERLVMTSNTTVYVWNIAPVNSPVKELLALSNDTNAVETIVFSPDGKRFAAAGNKIVEVWDIVSGQELFSVLAKTEEVQHIAFSPMGVSSLAPQVNENGSVGTDRPGPNTVTKP